MQCLERPLNTTKNLIKKSQVELMSNWNSAYVMLKRGKTKIPHYWLLYNT